MIASQAVISGAFSVTNQAVHLSSGPYLAVKHTSSEMGQIYVRRSTGSLYIAVVLLVLSFKSSSNVAAAYGFSVCTAVVMKP